jgi:hypothetical protein
MTDNTIPTTPNAAVAGFHWSAGDAMIAAESQRRAEGEAADRATTDAAIEAMRRRNRTTDDVHPVDALREARNAALADREVTRNAFARDVSAYRNERAEDMHAQVADGMDPWFVSGIEESARVDAERRLAHTNRQRARIGKPPVDADGNEITE